MRFCLMALLAAPLFFSFPLAAQTEVAAVSAGDDGAAAGNYAPPPERFRDFSLGMDLEALKSALQKDGLFDFRGDRDVSLLPGREQSLIETTGFSFVRRAFFQFRDGKLFIMVFNLDTGIVDHYSVYTAFVRKYGEPAALSPKEAVWESDAVRVAVERPLTVKYIDKQVFNEIVSESKTSESSELFLRQEFLDDF